VDVDARIKWLAGWNARLVLEVADLRYQVAMLTGEEYPPLTVEQEILDAVHDRRDIAVLSGERPSEPVEAPDTPGCDNGAMDETVTPEVDLLPLMAKVIERAKPVLASLVEEVGALSAAFDVLNRAFQEAEKSTR
jgi:hypothetical protein